MRSGHVLFTYLSLFIFGFIDNARGPVYPKVIEVFNASNSESSWMFTLTSLVSFLMSLAIPLWLARFGAVKASKAAMLFHAAALLAMGGAGLSGEYFWLFLAGSACLGVAIGIQSVTVNLIISKVSTPYNGSRLFSGLHSMYGMASLLAPLLLGVTFGLGLSWQWTLIVLTALPLAHFIFYFRLAPLDLSQAATAKGGAPFKTVARLGVVFSFYMATEILISSRMVAYLNSTDTVGLDKASYALTAFFILLLAGRLFFSFHTPRIPGKILLLVSAGATLGFYLAALLWNPLALALTGASISYFFPFGMNHIKSRYDQAEAIIAKVMMFSGAMLASMHFLFGLLSDSFGIERAMWIGPMFVLVVLALLFFERD